MTALMATFIYKWFKRYPMIICFEPKALFSSQLGFSNFRLPISYNIALYLLFAVCVLCNRVVDGWTDLFWLNGIVDQAQSQCAIHVEIWQIILRQFVCLSFWDFVRVSKISKLWPTKSKYDDFDVNHYNINQNPPKPRSTNINQGQPFKINQ